MVVHLTPWHVGPHQLPQSAAFKYLGFIFHESGSMSTALQRLAQNGKGGQMHEFTPNSNVCSATSHFP